MNSKLLEKIKRRFLKKFEIAYFIPILMLIQTDLIIAEEIFNPKLKRFSLNLISKTLISYELRNSQRYPPNSLINNCSWDKPHFYNKEKNIRFCILHSAGEIYTVNKNNSFQKFANLNKFESVPYRKECYLSGLSNVPDWACPKIEIWGKQIYKIIGNDLFKLRCGSSRKSGVRNIKCTNSKSRFISQKKIGERFF